MFKANGHPQAQAKPEKGSTVAQRLAICKTRNLRCILATLKHDGMGVIAVKRNGEYVFLFAKSQTELKLGDAVLAKLRTELVNASGPVMFEFVCYKDHFHEHVFEGVSGLPCIKNRNWELADFRSQCWALVALTSSVGDDARCRINVLQEWFPTGKVSIEEDGSFRYPSDEHVKAEEKPLIIVFPTWEIPVYKMEDKLAELRLSLSKKLSPDIEGLVCYNIYEKNDPRNKYAHWGAGQPYASPHHWKWKEQFPLRGVAYGIRLESKDAHGFQKARAMLRYKDVLTPTKDVHTKSIPLSEGTLVLLRQALDLQTEVEVRLYMIGWAWNRKAHQVRFVFLYKVDFDPLNMKNLRDLADPTQKFKMDGPKTRSPNDWVQKKSPWQEFEKNRKKRDAIQAKQARREEHSEWNLRTDDWCTADESAKRRKVNEGLKQWCGGFAEAMGGATQLTPAMIAEDAAKARQRAAYMAGVREKQACVNIIKRLHNRENMGPSWDLDDFIRRCAACGLVLTRDLRLPEEAIRIAGEKRTAEERLLQEQTDQRERAQAKHDKWYRELDQTARDKYDSKMKEIQELKDIVATAIRESRYYTYQERKALRARGKIVHMQDDLSYAKWPYVTKGEAEDVSRKARSAELSSSTNPKQATGRAAQAISSKAQAGSSKGQSAELPDLNESSSTKPKEATGRAAQAGSSKVQAERCEEEMPMPVQGGPSRTHSPTDWHKECERRRVRSGQVAQAAAKRGGFVIIPTGLDRFTHGPKSDDRPTSDDRDKEKDEDEDEAVRRRNRLDAWLLESPPPRREPTKVRTQEDLEASERRCSAWMNGGK